MNKKDIDIIYNILDLDKKIYIIYGKLSELEDNENNNLYNKYKYMLKILIASENNLYSSFGNSYERLSGCLEYVESLTMYDFEPSPIYAICDYDDENLLSYYRMYEKIKMILMGDNQFVADNLDEDLKIFESNKDDGLDYIRVMNYNLAHEYHKMNMLFLNESDDVNVVKRKYLYCFVAPLIENEMIDNDFIVTNCSFWDNLRIDSKYSVFESYIFSKFGMENAKMDLKNLLDFALIDDFNIYDGELIDDVDFNSIICSFKVGLLFLNDEDIIKLKKWIDFFSNNILSDDNIYNVEDLEELENMSEDTQEKMEKLESIKEYIGNILEQIDDYRKIANKDAQGKTYRL